MSEVSIITNDEIMEMTQLVFDRYYTELKRQLGRGEIPAEKAESYCTEILFKVYRALQEQGVAATSYEMDACAIPIINEEIRNILVPLHLNGYRNLREHPVTETQSETAANLNGERVVENMTKTENSKNSTENVEQAAEKAETVPVVSNGEVQVYQDASENQLNPELSMEIRRILQQEFQLEPAQVKPVVVVVNVTAPQAVAAQTEEMQATTQMGTPQTETPQVAQTVTPQKETVLATGTDAGVVAEIVSESVVAENGTTEGNVPRTEQNISAVVRTAEEVKIESVQQPDSASVSEPIQEASSQEKASIPVEIIEIGADELTKEEIAATAEVVEAEPLPELDFDVESLVQESTDESAKKKESSHLGLWIPIILLLMILLWLTTGMLMGYEIIPEFNLGYEWFNENVFELF